jgi:hypothetical protein
MRQVPPRFTRMLFSSARWARDRYRFVADAWREPDPELQAYVTEARNALRRLGT